MQRDYHRWYSNRLERDMAVIVYGHWGTPLIAFPTSGGDEWEYESQGMVGALADFIEAGKIKFVSVGSVAGQSFYNKGAHPFHRSYVLAQFDSYIRYEVVPFLWTHCRGQVAIATMGASLGAYHAANTIFKHPDVIKGCFGLSGQYDIKSFMDGLYDENLYFNNPVDYLPNLSDPSIISALNSCEIHIATGTGPWEHSGPSYYLASILQGKRIRCHLDDWGSKGGHDWPYWKNQMREYVGGLF